MGLVHIMEEAMQIGANHAAVLQGFIDQLAEIAAEKQEFSDDIREFRKELREKELPVAEMLSLARASKRSDDDKIADAAKDRLARQVLGLPVFRKDRVPGTKDLDAEVITLARRRVEEILSIGEEKKLLGVREGEVMAAAKEAGFLPKILRKVVAFRVNPDKRTAFDKDAGLIKAYLEAAKGPATPD